jgi:hypothetical protein
MNLFGRSKMRTHEANVDALRLRTARLTAKRATALQELDRATAARQQFAVTGDLDGAGADAAMAKLQGAVDAASSALVGLDAALAELAKQLADSEAQLAAEQDRVARTAASEKLAMHIASIEPRIAAWLEETRSLGVDLEKFFGTVRFDAIALGGYLLRSVGEVELASAVLVADLCGAVPAILSGAEPIPVEPVMIEPAPAMPAPETVRVFPLQNLAWTDAAGIQQTARRFLADCDLTPAAARTALSRGAACRLTDPRRRQLAGRQGTAHARALTLDECENLDAPPAQSTAEPVLHSAFEPMDRGKTYIVRAPKEKAAS